jgi:hypothetical protein
VQLLRHVADAGRAAQTVRRRRRRRPGHAALDPVQFSARRRRRPSAARSSTTAKASADTPRSSPCSSPPRRRRRPSRDSRRRRRERSRRTRARSTPCSSRVTSQTPAEPRQTRRRRRNVSAGHARPIPCSSRPRRRCLPRATDRVVEATASAGQLRRARCRFGHVARTRGATTHRAGRHRTRPQDTCRAEPVQLSATSQDGPRWDGWSVTRRREPSADTPLADPCSSPPRRRRPPNRGRSCSKHEASAGQCQRPNPCSSTATSQMPAEATAHPCFVDDELRPRARLCSSRRSSRPRRK